MEGCDGGCRSCFGRQRGPLCRTSIRTQTRRPSRRQSTGRAPRGRASVSQALEPGWCGQVPTEAWGEGGGQRWGANPGGLCELSGGHEGTSGATQKWAGGTSDPGKVGGQARADTRVQARDDTGLDQAQDGGSRAGKWPHPSQIVSEEEATGLADGGCGDGSNTGVKDNARVLTLTPRWVEGRRSVEKREQRAEVPPPAHSQSTPTPAPRVPIHRHLVHNVRDRQTRGAGRQAAGGVAADWVWGCLCRAEPDAGGGCTLRMHWTLLDRTQDTASCSMSFTSNERKNGEVKTFSDEQYLRGWAVGRRGFGEGTGPYACGQGATAPGVGPLVAQQRAEGAEAQPRVPGSRASSPRRGRACTSWPRR